MVVWWLPFSRQPKFSSLTPWGGLKRRPGWYAPGPRGPTASSASPPAPLADARPPPPVCAAGVWVAGSSGRGGEVRVMAGAGPGNAPSSTTALGFFLGERPEQGVVGTCQGCHCNWDKRVRAHAQTQAHTHLYMHAHRTRQMAIQNSKNTQKEKRKGSKQH